MWSLRRACLLPGAKTTSYVCIGALLQTAEMTKACRVPGSVDAHVVFWLVAPAALLLASNACPDLVLGLMYGRAPA